MTNGVGEFVFTPTRKGTHTLTLTYLGSAQVAADAANARSVRVY